MMTCLSARYGGTMLAKVFILFVWSSITVYPWIRSSLILKHGVNACSTKQQSPVRRYRVAPSRPIFGHMSSEVTASNNIGDAFTMAQKQADHLQVGYHKGKEWVQLGEEHRCHTTPGTITLSRIQIRYNRNGFISKGVRCLLSQQEMPIRVDIIGLQTACL